MKKYYLAISLLFFTGSLSAEDSIEPSGDKVMELNKKIKESRAKVATCRDGKTDDPECKKAEEELNKMRDERETMLKNWPEGKGLRKKLRREAARDRIKARREKAAEGADQTTTTEPVEPETLPAEPETPPASKE